jgi:DNA-binding transcriptional LysR family regulator
MLQWLRLHLSEAKLFREISQTRSISRAATHCGISQSAATQHVQEVERRLGLPLVDRSTRPLALTDAGKLYADFCREVLRREEQFLVALDQLKGSAEGLVRVA